MATKTIPKLKAELQIIFNEFIRLRDKDQPCISCGRSNVYKQAGHFFTVRMFDGLLFDEDNVHGECVRCNAFDSNHLIGYTQNLVNRIGKDAFADLQKMAIRHKQNGHYKWNRTELNDLIKLYKEKIKELKNS